MRIRVTLVDGEHRTGPVWVHWLVPTITRGFEQQPMRLEEERDGGGGGERLHGSNILVMNDLSILSSHQQTEDLPLEGSRKQPSEAPPPLAGRSLTW